MGMHEVWSCDVLWAGGDLQARSWKSAKENGALPDAERRFLFVCVRGGYQVPKMSRVMLLNQLCA